MRAARTADLNMILLLIDEEMNGFWRGYGSLPRKENCEEEVMEDFVMLEGRAKLLYGWPR